MLAVGTTAPDFELYRSPQEKLRLSDLRGRNVILAFYPADWSPVCGNQMSLYHEMESFFTRQNAQLIGLSVDSRWCHAAFAAENGFGFPLLADFEPKGAVSKVYEAYDEQVGESQRALYVIDGSGIIRWSYLSPIDVNPGADGILEALEKINQ